MHGGFWQRIPAHETITQASGEAASDGAAAHPSLACASSCLDPTSTAGDGEVWDDEELLRSVMCGQKIEGPDAVDGPDLTMWDDLRFEAVLRRQQRALPPHWVPRSDGVDDGAPGGDEQMLDARVRMRTSFASFGGVAIGDHYKWVPYYPDADLYPAQRGGGEEAGGGDDGVGSAAMGKDGWVLKALLSDLGALALSKRATSVDGLDLAQWMRRPLGEKYTGLDEGEEETQLEEETQEETQFDEGEEETQLVADRRVGAGLEQAGETTVGQAGGGAASGTCARRAAQYTAKMSGGCDGGEGAVEVPSVKSKVFEGEQGREGEMPSREQEREGDTPSPTRAQVDFQSETHAGASASAEPAAANAWSDKNLAPVSNNVEEGALAGRAGAGDPSPHAIGGESRSCAPYDARKDGRDMPGARARLDGGGNYDTEGAQSARRCGVLTTGRGNSHILAVPSGGGGSREAARATQERKSAIETLAVSTAAANSGLSGALEEADRILALSAQVLLCVCFCGSRDGCTNVP